MYQQIFRCQTLGLTALLALGAVAARGEEKAPTVKLPALVGEAELPVLAVFTQNHGRRADPAEDDPFAPKVIVAVWKDGRVVWSKDDLRGGPPYREGRIQPESVRKWLDDRAKEGVFRDRTLDRAWFGPDSKFTAVAVLDGANRLLMQSWHELYESGGTLVATTSGLELLEGRDRAKVLADQPEEYRRYRKTWDALRAGARALVPAEGRDAGKLRFEIRRAEAKGKS